MIKIIGSFSGGESSSVMVEELEKLDKTKYDVRYIFCNTSREDERTLIFVDRIAKYYNIDIIWLETVVNPKKNKGVGFNITNFKEAKRNGEVFESWIAKYGQHGISSPGCSRDLKGGTCLAYMKSIGFEDAKIAIGFRRDEPKRVNLLKAAEWNQIYPLWEKGYTKRDIKNICARRPFLLGLLEWEGNCKLCFKKSKRKRLTQIYFDPKSAEWLCEIEDKYPNNPTTGEKMYMFRDKETIYDLIDLAKLPFRKWVEPIYVGTELFDYELDETSDCEESCEVEFDRVLSP